MSFSLPPQQCNNGTTTFTRFFRPTPPIHPAIVPIGPSIPAACSDCK